MRQGPGTGKYIAGGTDLLLQPPPKCDFVVDLNEAGLGEIATTGQGDLFLGSTATLQKIATSPLVLAFAGGAVSRAAAHCGNRPIRSVATIGGNLCHAVPSADMAPILLALDAVAHISDGDRDEVLPLADFFTGPKQTVLGDRLLLGVSLPAAGANWRAAVHKLKRAAEDISLVQVAVAVDISGGAVRAARIALGAVAPVPLRAMKAEEILIGMKAGAGTGDAAAAGIDSAAATTIERAAGAAAAASGPIDDLRASADYRRAMIEVLTRRLIRQLMAADAGGTS
jgi:carbon-monoxide dehydrogenase medium subunit